MPRAPTVILAAGIAVAIACAPAAGGASELVTPPPGDALADAPWVPDLGNGRYRNPVLAADYSDPDVVRVGEDYYLTSSSFTNVPGLPILRSKDLVNWTLIGHALPRLLPIEHYAIPRRGGGVWAPSIRYHAGQFYIYYPDPDYGIYVVTAKNPAGPWTIPRLADASRGAIDPCPLWDDDGKAWLIFAWAKSRAGFNNVLTLKRLSADGMRTLGPSRVVVDGNRLAPAQTSAGPMGWEPIEGPKLYKRKGWYYIFAPAGGVRQGWEAVFRSRNIEGPYEGRDVLDQGHTDVNGPHQGAWVHTAQGEDWFLHFQDTDAYGRRVYLEPMRWRDGWPVIGRDTGDPGRGEPVLEYRKPETPAPVARAVPRMSDEFDDHLSLAWQWSANPRSDWMSLTAHPGFLRLNALPSPANLYQAGNLLTQKFPGPEFTVTARMRLEPKAIGERAGLLVFGNDYAWIGLAETTAGLRLVQDIRLGADRDRPQVETAAIPVSDRPVYLRLHARQVREPLPAPAGPRSSSNWPSNLREFSARVTFSYSLDGAHYIPLGKVFLAHQGPWVGSVFGLFAQLPSGADSQVAAQPGYAEFDWLRVSR